LGGEGKEGPRRIWRGKETRGKPTTSPLNIGSIPYSKGKKRSRNQERKKGGSAGPPCVGFLGKRNVKPSFCSGTGAMGDREGEGGEAIL